jgi:hypothetical protein
LVDRYIVYVSQMTFVVIMFAMYSQNQRLVQYRPCYHLNDIRKGPRRFMYQLLKRYINLALLRGTINRNKAKLVETDRTHVMMAKFIARNKLT